jgi:hypothetical protein
MPHRVAPQTMKIEEEDEDDFRVRTIWTLASVRLDTGRRMNARGFFDIMNRN